VEQDVVGDDGRHAHLRGEIRQLVEPELVVGPAPQRERQIGPVPERVAQAAQPEPALVIGEVRHEDGDQSFAIGDEIRPFEMTLGLAAALLAERQQPAQPRIGRTVGRVDQHRHAVCEIKPTADDQAYAGRLGRLMGANDAGERIAVDDGERLDAEQAPLRRTALRRTTRPRRKLKCEVTCSSA
jgi:hypothetical protein